MVIATMILFFYTLQRHLTNRTEFDSKKNFATRLVRRKYAPVDDGFVQSQIFTRKLRYLLLFCFIQLSLIFDQQNIKHLLYSIREIKEYSSNNQ